MTASVIDSDTRLFAGASRIDITPPADCMLDGFAARDHGCEGVHDKLYAECLALRRYGSTAVILGIDLLGQTEDQMMFLWEESARRFGLAPGSLFVNCSHTHAGPLLRSRFNSKFCREGELFLPDSALVVKTMEGILDSIELALGLLKPATLAWASGETRIGIYRRSSTTAPDSADIAREDRIYENIPNPGKDIDRTCPVLMASGDDGNPIGLVFGASCHPTTLRYDNYLVSADFPGAAKRLLRERFSGIPSVFLQGMGGDVKPRRVADGDTFRNGTFEDVEAVGKELAEDVLRTIEGGLETLDVNIRTALGRYPLPLAGGWNENTYRIMASENPSWYRRVWARHWLDRIGRGEIPPQSRDITLSMMELAPGLRMIGVAGELLTDMGMKIRNRYRDGVTLPMGYTNGRIGYIPDAAVMKEGGYEPVETVYFTNDMPAPWREDIETVLLGHIDDLGRRCE